MRIQTLATAALAGVLAPLVLAACDLDVPDLNDPSLDDLKNHPNAISIGAASTGLLIGNRGNKAAENGYVVQLGILGREAYNFDAADPRYFTEMLVGKLRGGSPFGGNFWAGPYTNLQLGNVILGAIDKVTDLSDDAKAAVRGFTKTINALDLLEVVVTHDKNGAVLDVNPDPLGELPPVVTDTAKEYAKIVSLLEGAVTDLTTAKNGGDAFPFALGKGFAGFDAPSTFLKFNRALRARVAVYTGDYAMALTALGVSFINDDDTKLDPNVGVYYAYSTKPGDSANALINPNIFVHPSIVASVAKDAMGNPSDARLLRKTQEVASPGGARITEGLQRDPPLEPLPVLSFKALYPNPEASVPVIRNEELVLLEAEARWFTSDHAGALKALNAVRKVSGKLDDPATATTDAEFISALLYERRYSLLFEGGHRWIDARRLDLRFTTLATLPIFVTVDKDTGDKTPDTLNVRYPLPQGECNARPAEPACMLGST